jgi:hypothetical protein
LERHEAARRAAVAADTRTVVLAQAAEAEARRRAEVAERASVRVGDDFFAAFGKSDR